MKILFGGVRGSTPCAEPETARYGGHTTCLLVTGQAGELLLLDAGSGIRTAAAHLAAKPAPDPASGSADPAPTAGLPPTAEPDSRDLLILLTHLHLDHLLGLPMLQVLHDARWQVTIAGARPATGGSLREVLERLLSPPVWPFALEDFPATIMVRELDPDADSPADPGLSLSLGGLAIRGVPVPHPNGCTAWRIDEAASRSSLVFATDMEWSAADEGERKAFLDLCTRPGPVDLLVMDGHFAPEEIADKAGWGHSSTAACVDVARACYAGRLLITHHAPDNSDARLDAMAAQARRLWEHADLARQGLEINLDTSPGKEPRP